MRRPFVLLLSFLSLLPGARAQDAPPSFGESIDVRVVNVEAVVTDRQGNRVSGLKPEDFRLRVDGREVPVEYFSEVRDGEALPAAPAAAAPAEAAQAPAKAAVQGVAEGRVGTYYLLFIDDFFSIPAQRNVVLKGFKDEIGRLGPDDRMAIVAYDGGRLTMVSNWSGSPADLGRAFDQAMARRTRSLGRSAEKATAESDQGFSAQSVGDGAPLDLSAQQPGLSDIQRRYAGDLIRQIRGDVQAAVSTLRAFAAPRGRKVMLLLSGGWPFSVQSYVSHGSGMPTKELPEGEDLYRPLTSTANLLGYTLYPVDVPGVQSGAADVNATPPPTSGDPELVRGFSSAVAGAGETVPSALLLGGFGNLSEHEVEGSLKYLAQETGGKPILNSNRALALGLARDDTRSFYWLGFSPAWKHDDKRHEIKLEARRSGLRVRTRTGFLDLSRKAEVTMTVESALLFGNPPGALRMPLKVGEVARSKRGEIEIPITLGLPVDLMTVVPDGKRFTVQLELRFAASDAAGDTAEIPTVPVTLTSDHAPAPGKVVKYETRVKLRGKADHMVVAAYDPLSGKIATAETDLKMP
jgi:VWFA-related protein